jgi:flagellar hook-associated protein 2
MSIISSVGVSSGIDYSQLISGILELERQPIYRLQNRQSEYNDKISVYNTLSSKLDTLKDAADKLRNSTNFYEKTAAVSNETVIDATASNSASAGIYTIEAHSVAGKIQLASVDRRTGTTSFTSSTDVINSSGATKTFEYTYNGTTRTISVSDGSTLEDLRDAINSDTGNPGVTATIVNVGTNDYRLVLTGQDSGSTMTITITANTDLTGFSDTDFTAHTAQDAKFRIGGIDVVKSSNTISDVIPGVTFTLKSESTTSVTITVNNDIDTIRQNIEDFVSAYNDIVDYIDTNSQYDVTTRTGNPLTGETTSRNIMNRLRDIVTSRVAGNPEDLRTLAQLGITTDYETGHLEIDSATLENKLTTDLSDVETLFDDQTSGIAYEMYNYIDDVTDSTTGSISIRVDGLQDSVQDMSDEISEMEDRLTILEENLRRQFAALESLLTEFHAQSAFLTNLINNL